MVGKSTHPRFLPSDTQRDTALTIQNAYTHVSDPPHSSSHGPLPLISTEQYSITDTLYPSSMSSS